MLSHLTLLEVAAAHSFSTLLRVTRLEAILAVTKPRQADLGGLTSFEGRVLKKFVKATGLSREVAVDTMDILLEAHDQERLRAKALESRVSHTVQALRACRAAQKPAC